MGSVTAAANAPAIAIVRHVVQGTIYAPRALSDAIHCSPHTLVENGHGLIVSSTVWGATGTAEKSSATSKAKRNPQAHARLESAWPSLSPLLLRLTID